MTAKFYQVDFTKKKLVKLEKEEKLLSENSMSKTELLNVIWTLNGSFNETNHPQFKGLTSKNKDDLLLILQKLKIFTMVLK